MNVEAMGDLRYEMSKYVSRIFATLLSQIFCLQCFEAFRFPLKMLEILRLRDISIYSQ